MRVGTWNLENLFHPGEGSGGLGTLEQFSAKLQALPATINEFAPDVLAVQEVGSPTLKELMGFLKGEDWTFALADPDERGIRVGFLSRLPIQHQQQIPDYAKGIAPVQIDDTATTSKLSRSLLHITVNTPAGRAGPRNG